MESIQTLLEPTSGAIPRQASLVCPELEESPQIFSAKEILVNTSSSPWIVTKTIKTIQIQTYDIKLVRAAVEALSVTQPENTQLENEFNERADRWERESSIHSSPGEKFLHRDYLRIIGKGEPIVPLILERLKSSKKDWLFALENIVPEDENPAKGVENFKEAAKAWLAWGADKYPALE